MRRVVVTGLGMVSPLSSSVDGTWSKLLNGISGAAKISRFDTKDFTTDYACEIKFGDGNNDSFNRNSNKESVIFPNLYDS